jgi:hypothetical protein
MCRRDAARHLQENYGWGSESMLAQAASNGNGPVFYKDGPKMVFYLQEDLNTWAQARVKRVAPPDPAPAPPGEDGS